MPPSPTRPAGERGVALLIVLVVLFIIAVLMVDITLTATTARRSAKNASSEFLMDAAIEGRFLVMTAQLTYDAAENKIDSPDDRWARPEYTEYTAPEKTQEELDQAEEAPVRVVGDSDEVSVMAPERLKMCEAENAKFNLHLLMHPNKDKRETSRERFAVLLDRFREDTPLDISRTKAEEIRDRVVDYLERAMPGEGETGKFPVAKYAALQLLTPEELRNVAGFEDTTHGLGAEGILFDARSPQEAREYEADPVNAKPPEVCRGLLHFVTLWSGDAWIPKDGTSPTDAYYKSEAYYDSMLPVNVNLAEKPVLETLFNPSDILFAERIRDYREAEKDDSRTSTTDPPKVDEALPRHKYFETMDDLKKVDGLDQSVIDRTPGKGAAITFQSGTFSLNFQAKRDKSFKQVRYVVRRNNQGFQTLLRETRADPRFEEEEATADEGTGGD